MEMETAAAGKQKHPGVLTARKLAACLRSLEKARAAPKNSERYSRSRRNNLRHRLYTRALRESVPRVAESLEEFDEYLRLFQHAFSPQDEPEEAILRHLGETAWRRLRLYRAHAYSEARRVRRLLGPRTEAKALTAEETRELARFLLAVLFNSDETRLAQRASRFLGHIERLPQALLSKRTDGNPNFEFFARRHRYESTLLLEEWIPSFDGSRRLLKNQQRAAQPPVRMVVEATLQVRAGLPPIGATRRVAPNTVQSQQ